MSASTKESIFWAHLEDLMTHIRKYDGIIYVQYETRDKFIHREIFFFRFHLYDLKRMSTIYKEVFAFLILVI